MDANVKVLVVEVAKIGVCLDQAIVDKLAGRGFLVEAKDLFPAFVGLPSAIGDTLAAISEVKSLTPSDILDLEAAVQAELANLPQANVAGVVQAALNAIVAVLSLVSAIKAM